MGNCMQRVVDATADTADTAYTAGQQGECPICMHEFGSGPRTVVRPFHCTGGQAHGVCRACDSTLWRRIDDRCPVCRAPRDVAAAAARHGAREDGVPVHMRSNEGEMGAAQIATMFFPVEAPYSMVSGPSFSILRPHDAADVESANVVAQLVRTLATQGAIRGAPFMASIEGNDETGDSRMIPDAIVALMAAVHGDRRTADALRGLGDVTTMPLGEYVSRVRGERGSARTERRPAPRLRSRRSHNSRV